MIQAHSAMGHRLALIETKFDGLTEYQPRAVGMVDLATKTRGVATVLDRLTSSGSLKTLFPRSNGSLEAILINTSGGLTGGDIMNVTAVCGDKGDLVLTTQAAERVYRASAGHATVHTELRAATGARFSWLPQETILYDASALKRRLRVELADDARFLMVEPIIFGRREMGECLTDIALDDRIEIRREARPLVRERFVLTTETLPSMSHRALAGGAVAMATILCVSPTVAACLGRVRSLLPEAGGASLRAPDTMIVRILAADGFSLRQHLVSVLECLADRALPRSWSL